MMENTKSKVMKKIILLALTALMMVGCFNDNDEYKAPYKNGDITCGYKELAVYFGE